MTNKIKISLLAVILFCVHITAQQSATYTSDLVDFQKALTLYNNQQYQASQSLFRDVLKSAENDVLKSDCAYYIANCAVRLNQQNADRLVEDRKSTRLNSSHVK